MEKSYIAIDLKSFYASVECINRGLDPMQTNLVVADISRTEKTICLAVSPSLKSFGIPGRPRLYEIVQKINKVNENINMQYNKNGKIKKSCNITELNNNKTLNVDYIIAKPQMAYYIKCSNIIYNIYLKYISHEDIHIYSIDEVFIDATKYLKIYNMSAHDLAMAMIKDVLENTGITATVGIGTNLYLSKIAMDIVAKKMPADKNGVRIASLNEINYRKQLWAHTPITDFWRVGKGYAKKLAKYDLYTMGDIARCSLGKQNDGYNEDLLYELFGVNAELLIDHAWGYEPCTITEIKSYKPKNTSICSGQVLQEAYPFDKARLVVHEMIDLLVLDLVAKNLVTDQIVLTVGYDIENLTNTNINYNGEVVSDAYGRKIPKHSHGTTNLIKKSSSTKIIVNAVMQLFDKIVNNKLLVRRISISANHLVNINNCTENENIEQLNFFDNCNISDTPNSINKDDLKKENSIQNTMISLKEKYGNNAIIKGMNLIDGATTIDRNKQIGGHNA